jgi:LPPG:FO 2-phospho-L-lactate transferase
MSTSTWPIGSDRGRTPAGRLSARVIDQVAPNAATIRRRRVVVLAGGVGGAKLVHGLALASATQRAGGAPGLDLSVIVNTGDDLELHGLLICPDLDTVMYTLAGLANPDTGWGIAGDTWSAAALLERFGAETWFRLGDADLATHVERTRRLRAGERLTEVTAALAGSLGVPAALLPMTDESVRTQVATADGWLEFQDYFVRRGHRDEVRAIRYAGIETARPTPDVLAAIGSADLVVFAPSNPFVSIGTILAVPGLHHALAASTARVAAVSPIVAGAALRGPADAMLVSLQGEASALAVARHYATSHPGLVDDFVIDTADADAAGGIDALGLRAHVAPTVMRSDADREGLAATVLALEEPAAD